MKGLVLSIFPGIDILGKAFEEQGYCVVRGPDKLWGGDIKLFHPPVGVFEGIIGGPPCQDFSPLKYVNKNAAGKWGNLIPEFERVVTEAQPEWFIMENTKQAPIPKVAGYQVDPTLYNNRWTGNAGSATILDAFGVNIRSVLDESFTRLHKYCSGI
jgi:DNA (cytosine-5)-methyltransferase 1